MQQHGQIPSQPAAGLFTAQALQEFDLIFRAVQQSPEPAVRSEGLHALGAALHPLVQALLPTSALAPNPAAPETAQAQATHADEVNAGDVPASTCLVESGNPQHEHQQQRPQHGQTQHQQPQHQQVQQEQQQQHSQDQQGQRQQAVKTGSKQELCEAVARLVALAQSSSGAHQFDDIRLAAVKALEASGKHATPTVLPICLPCRSWMQQASALYHFCLCLGALKAFDASGNHSGLALAPPCLAVSHQEKQRTHMQCHMDIHSL